jgi:hypothetical protein
MIAQCYVLVIKSAVKQEAANSTEAATRFEEFRCISILAVRDCCSLSITSCAVTWHRIPDTCGQRKHEN